MRAFSSNDIVFNGQAVVFHPDVPGEVIVCLRAAGPRRMVSFKDESPARQARDAVWSSWLWGLLWGGIADLAVCGAIAAWIALFVATRTVRHRRRERRLAANARDYHRRYMVPHTDLDREAMNSWSRVIRAASRIVNSDVVEQQRIQAGVTAIRERAESPDPKRHTIRESLYSIRAILENAGGGAAAVALLDLLHHLSA